MDDDDARRAVVEAIGAVAPDTDPADADREEDVWYALDLDSMDQLNVMVGISERTGVEVPERDYPRLRSIDAMVDYLVAATAGEPAG